MASTTKEAIISTHKGDTDTGSVREDESDSNSNAFLDQVLEESAIEMERIKQNIQNLHSVSDTKHKEVEQTTRARHVAPSPDANESSL